MTMLEKYRFETRQFVVRAFIEGDPDMDTSWDETGETAAKLASGEYEGFCTTVEVITKTGMKLAQTTLSGSIYADPSEFFKEHRVAGNKGACYFPGMVREAIGEARTALERMPKVKPTMSDERKARAYMVAFIGLWRGWNDALEQAADDALVLTAQAARALDLKRLPRQLAEPLEYFVRAILDDENPADLTYSEMVDGMEAAL